MDSGELVALVKRIAEVRGRNARMSAEDREDLAQQVTEQYLLTWKDGEQPDNVKAWLETATGNALLNRVRAARNNPVMGFGQGEAEPVALAVGAIRGEVASAPAVRADLARRVRASLDDDENELFDLVLLELTDRDIAEQLGISPAAAKSRRHRLVAKMRVALEADPGLLTELRKAHPHVYPTEQRRQGRPR